MTTIQLPPDFKEFLRLLSEHSVRFLLVGGYAVNAYGSIRNTIDIDIWIDGEESNRERTIAAIRTFGFASASTELLADADAILRMGVPPLRIEVMQTLSGVEFEPCWEQRVELQVDDWAVPMISLADLKRNKRAAARPKDLADLSGLP